MPFPLKNALRRLAHSPGFAVVAIVMLALGVAMSTSAFSFASGALLRPLPFRDAGQLVRIFTTSPRAANWPLAPGNALDVRDDLAAVGEFAIFSFEQEGVGQPGQTPDQQSGLAASPNLLRVLGVQPALGRDFLGDDNEHRESAEVLLTHGFWVARFGANPAVLGSALRIDGSDYTVVGVLPPTFDEPLLWHGCSYITRMTVRSGWQSQRSTRWMHVLGRLNSGVSTGEVKARLDNLLARLAQEYPTEIGQTRFRVTVLGSSFATPGVRMTYWLSVALSVAVLLITCANLAGVQLARTLSRRRELVVRAALGASASDLFAVLAVESVVLAVLGTAAGVVLTFCARAWIQRWVGGEPAPIDGRVLAFAIVTGALAVVTFGLVPARLAARGAMSDALKEGSRAVTPGPHHQRLKRGLVVAQFALAFILVCAAASFVVGVRAFLARDRGWHPDGLVAGELTLPPRLAQKEKTSPGFGLRLKDAIERLPGVERVATASTVPLYGYQHPGAVVVEGAVSHPGQEPMAYITGVAPTFFSVLSVPIVEGRLFSAEWRPGDPPVAVVSASTARRLFPGQSAVGKRVLFPPESRWHEIVGVVGDVSLAVTFDVPVANLQVYRPVQEPFGPMYSFVLKSSLPAATLERQIRQAVAAIDPDIMIARVGNVPQMLEQLAGHGRVVAVLVAFAGAGLLIAIMGLYGLMSQLAHEREREVGIRLALGADYARIVALMLGNSGRVLAVALATGLAGSVALRVLLETTMPGLPSLSAATVTAIALLLATAGLLASYLPSHRAARKNPADVLRSE